MVTIQVKIAWKMFGKKLKQYTTEIINYEKNKMLPLTKKEENLIS